ncbi:Uncharacterised protein [Mycobacteroides abscessus subsp. abscessus]|nr:Uncharacterised protein [Mycobacteroides abscessus subsp. abscessus]
MSGSTAGWDVAGLGLSSTDSDVADDGGTRSSADATPTTPMIPADAAITRVRFIDRIARPPFMACRLTFVQSMSRVA